MSDVMGWRAVITLVADPSLYNVICPFFRELMSDMMGWRAVIGANMSAATQLKVASSCFDLYTTRDIPIKHSY